MPKREGYIIEQIADMNNLKAANKEAQSGGKAKKNRHIRRHNAKLTEHLEELQRMILEEDWPDVVYSPMVVDNDNGKRRKVDMNTNTAIRSLRTFLRLDIIIPP